MKKLLLIVAVAMAATMSFAQVNKAKMLLDEIAGNPDAEKLAQAKTAITDAIAKAKPNNLAYIYNVAAQVELRYLQAELEKMQNGQELDTMLFISSMDNAVELFTKSYTLDHEPDAKGKVKPKFDYGDKYTIGEHDGNLVWIKKVLGYYLIAAQFCYKNGDKAKTYEYYMKHLTLPKNPMFTPAQTDSIYKSDNRYPLVGYYATILVFQDKDYDKVLQTVDYAIQSEDAPTREDGYYMKSSSLLHKGDTLNWLATQKEAMENTSNTTYALNVLKYYYDHHQQAQVMTIADEFIKKAPENKMAHYIKGVALMDNKKDDEARKCFETALEKDPSFVDAKYNIAVLDFSKVSAFNANAILDNKDPKYKGQQQELMQMLTNSRKQFAELQELAPEKPDLWEAKLEQIDHLIGIVENNLAEVAKRDKK